jgi:hypothetical protein
MSPIDINPELASDGSPAPSGDPVHWSEWPLRDFVENGLLYQVNRQVLWDLGLALAVEVEGPENDRRYTRLLVMETVPATRIVDTPDTTRWQRLQRWLSERVGTVAP